MNHVLIGLILVAAAFAAWRTRWVCDDIFITLRYADNFVHGRGIVFNVGERVEGYTDFLWFLILSAAQGLGFDPVQSCMDLGVVSYLGTLAMFAWVSARRNRGSASFYIPFTALALALNADYRIWATSGMETSFFTFLVAGAFVIWFFSGFRRGVRLVCAGVLVIFATMTRPDGSLFFLLGNVLLLGGVFLYRRRIADYARDFAAFNAAFFLLYVPYFIWKVGYYHSIFPNTYYAKAAYLSEWGQGFYYIGLFFRVYWVSALFLPAGVVLGWMWIHRWKGEKAVAGKSGGLLGAGNRADPSDLSDRLDGMSERTGTGAVRPALFGSLAEFLKDPVIAPLFVAFAAAVVYLVFFVAKVGGDFMYARFVIPVVPFLYFTIEGTALRLFKNRVPVAQVLFLVLLAGVALEALNREALFPNDKLVNPTPDDLFKHRGIADEHWYYTAPINYNHTKSMIETGRIIGTFLRPYFKGLDATFLLSSQNVIAYYGGFRTCIEKNGLTDPTIAHEPITQAERAKMRVGHIKFPRYRYLVDRGTNFALLYPLPFVRPFQDARFFLPDGMAIPVTIITYNRRLMDTLRQRCGKVFKFVDFERYLDQYIARDLPHKSPADLLRDYLCFRDYYFRWNDDKKREKPFLDALGDKVKGAELMYPSLRAIDLKERGSTSVR